MPPGLPAVDFVHLLPEIILTIGALVMLVVGIPNAATATFLVNLGLSMAFLLSLIHI